MSDLLFRYIEFHLARIDERKAGIANKIARGQWETAAEAKKECGRYLGLEEASNMATEDLPAFLKALDQDK